MLSYIGKRLLMFIPTIIIISFLIFFIIQLPPGDYVTSYVAAMAAEGEIFTEAEILELRVQFGLDDPWFIQYFNWVKDIVTKGDFGYSFEYGRDVWAVVMDYLPLTMALSIFIMLFQYGVSLPIGIYCANHQYSAGDYIWSFFGFIGTATPNFLLAIIVYYVLYKVNGNMYVGLYSAEMMKAGFGTLPLPELIAKLPELTEYLPEFAFRLFLVLLVIGTSGTCGIIRTVRAQMLDEQSRQYTLCARAKGCSEATITYKYCLRAALNPVVSGLAGSLRTIFSGSTVSAIVMNLIILGPMLLKALKSQDMYLAGSTVLIQAVLVLVGTLLSDIALAWLDPRIRFSERG
jgi:peptide/nickel transport system permease protein